MLKSKIQILFNCKMWGREIEWNRKERWGGGERERGRNRDGLSRRQHHPWIQQCHVGLPSPWASWWNLGAPSPFKTFHYLKTLATKGINVHWLNGSWFQMLNTCYFLHLNSKFSKNIHRGTGSFLLHSNAIRKQKNWRCRHKEIGQIQHVPWSPLWSKTSWWPRYIPGDIVVLQSLERSVIWGFGQHHSF